MPSLTADLDVAFSGGNLSATLEGTVSMLGTVQASVQVVVDGPEALDDLLGSIDGLPIPDGLDALAQLPAVLVDLVTDVPESPGDLVQPLIAPLLELIGGELDVGAVAQIQAALCFLTKLLEAAVGGELGGGQGMPLAPSEWSRFAMPDGAEAFQDDIRSTLDSLGDFAEVLGGPLDATSLLAWTERASARWTHMSDRWPRLPIFHDAVEALGTAATWRSLDGPALTDRLAGQLEQTITLVSSPRTLAQAVITQAEAASSATTLLPEAHDALLPVLGRVSTNLGLGRLPAARDLGRLDEAIAELEQLHTALRLDRGLLTPTELRELPCRLERQLLVVVRAFDPPFDGRRIEAHVRAALAEVPAPPQDVFDDAVQGLEDLDLSAITGPLGLVRDAVQEAVQAVEDARDEVRDALTELLQPVADGMDSALDAAGIDQIRTALEDLPGTIQQFVDDEIMPAIQPVRDSISEAIDAVSGAVDAFDPEALLAEITAAVQSAVDILRTPEIEEAFATLESSLDQAISVIADFDISPAADEAVSSLESAEQTVSEIDPDTIPDAAKPLLRQAVQVVTDIEFSAEVSAPIQEGIEVAVREGPARIIEVIEGPFAELRASIEQFRPSQIVADLLDAPFQELLQAVDDVSPSDLLGRLDAALRSLVDMIPLDDVEQLIEPLDRAHADVADALARIRPSNLMQPVEQAIEDAVAKLFELTGIDDVFDGVDEVLAEIDSWLSLADGVRAHLDRAADLIDVDISVDDALGSLVDDTVARLADVDMAVLSPILGRLAEATASIERDALSADLAAALMRAGTVVSPALDSAALTELVAAVDAVPRDRLARLPDSRRLRQTRRTLDRLHAVTHGLVELRGPWRARGPGLRARAQAMQGDLLDYARIFEVARPEVFDDFATPADRARLTEDVRETFERTLRLPIALFFEMHGALVPHAAALARTLSRLIAATRAKLDSLVGEEGLGGIVGGVEELADMLRDIDLSPVTDPLDALWARIEQTWGVFDPEVLTEALRAAVDALRGLLQVSTLMGPEVIAELDATWQDVVDKLRRISPGELARAALDPIYDEALDLILPVLELPDRLNEALAQASATISTDVVDELARVEIAFDNMLSAIPLDGGGSGGSVSASASISVGA